MGRQELFGNDRAGNHSPIEQTSGCLHVYNQGYNFITSIGSNDATAKTGLDITTKQYGMLHNVNVNDGAAAGSLVLWSDPDNAGSVVLADIDVGTSTAPVTMSYDVTYVSGLFVNHSAKLAGHFTITYL